MAFHRGDVILVPFPFTDLTAKKTRPAVVVSGSAYHATQPDIIIAAITSNVPSPPRPMTCILTNWRNAGLQAPSAVKAVLATLHSAVVAHTIGRLTPQDMHGVDSLLSSALQP